MADPYLHGYTDEERIRLQRQAGVLAPWVHRDLPYASSRRLLEVGCGTGAQLELLLDAFPSLHVTGLDRSAEQLAAATRVLGGPRHAPRARLVEGRAERLPFEDGSFDAAFLCWILEHVASPAAVLAELHRVLAPGAPVVITEVVNATFHLDPPAPHTMRYWSAFNQHQLTLRGDPHVGAKLGHLLHHAGFTAIETPLREVILDDRDPATRADVCRACTDLLLSASDALLAAGRLDPPTIDGMRDELARIGRGPGTVFFYAFTQARARR